MMIIGVKVESLWKFCAGSKLLNPFPYYLQSFTPMNTMILDLGYCWQKKIPFPFHRPSERWVQRVHCTRAYVAKVGRRQIILHI